MKTQDLATAQPDFLLSTTTVPQRNQLLIDCAANNDLAGLQKLITAEPAIVKRAGEDAFAKACGAGHLDVVKRLHTLGVKVDGFLFDDSNPAVTIAQYPLHCAFENSQWVVAQWLVDHGAKVMHMPRVLANMINHAPALFALMLKDIPYIAAYETPVSARTGSDDKVHADALAAVLDVIAHHDNAPYAALLRDAGLSARSLYDVAMKKHAYAILRDLYQHGYRPDPAQMAAHKQILATAQNNAEGIEQVTALIAAGVHADNHLQLDDATLAACQRDFTQSFAAGDDVPAALLLARAGAFPRVVAPALPQAGMDLLQLQDTHGATLIDVLVARGEEMQIFDPAIWRGNFAQAAALHAQLPTVVRESCDLAAISAQFGRYRMGVPQARFKFGRTGTGGQA